MERRKPLRANPDTTRAWQDRSRRQLPRRSPPAAGAFAGPARAPLAKRGARAKRLEPALRAAYQQVDQRDANRCQYDQLDPAHRCPPGTVTHHDHLWGRNVRPDLREDPRAIVLLCSTAHDEVTRNPVLHRELRRAILENRALAELQDTCPRPLLAPIGGGHAEGW